MKRAALAVVIVAAVALSALAGYHVRQRRATGHPPGSMTVVVFGDSVTAGYFEDGVLDQAAGYVERLRGHLIRGNPDCVVNVINAGVAGDTAAVALRRVERDVLRYEPDLVVVAFGLNDAVAGDPAACRAATDEIVGRLAAAGVDRVVLVTPSFLCTRPGLNHGPHAARGAEFAAIQTGGGVAAVAQAVRDVAAGHGLPVADVYAEWSRRAAAGQDTDAMLSNGLNHPTRDAHAIHAELISAAVRERWPGPPRTP